MNKIIYVAPNNVVLTYHVTGEITYKENMVKFFDEKTKEFVILPLDRCQIREVK